MKELVLVSIFALGSCASLVTNRHAALSSSNVYAQPGIPVTHNQDLIGPSGIVTPNGNIQFTLDQAQQLNKPSLNNNELNFDRLTSQYSKNQDVIGPSGIVSHNGNVQFTIEQAQDFVKSSETTPTPIFINNNIGGASRIVTAKDNIHHSTDQIGKLSKFVRDPTLSAFTHSPQFLIPHPTTHTSHNSQLRAPRPPTVLLNNNSQFRIPNSPSFISNKQQNENRLSFFSIGSNNENSHFNKNKENEFENSRDIPRISSVDRLIDHSQQIVPPTFQSSSFVPSISNRAKITSAFHDVVNRHTSPSISQVQFMQGDDNIILEGFTSDQVENIAFIGPSGIVTKDGKILNYL